MNKIVKIVLCLLITLEAHSSDKSEEWFSASREGDIKTIERSLSLTNINMQNEKGYSAFILASYNGHLDAALFLLSKGADPCLNDMKGNNALMGVLFKGHKKLSDLIIPLCDVNHRNLEGQTPLMYASLFNRDEAVKDLLKRGASREIKDNNGRTAESLAEGQWNQAMVKLLRTFRFIQ